MYFVTTQSLDFSPFFFPFSPSLSLSSEEEDDDDEDPEEQDDEDDDELDPEWDEEEEDEEEDEDERDEELDDEPPESVPDVRLSLRPLLLAFLGFLSDELGVRGFVLAATICPSPSGLSSTAPAGVCCAGTGLQLSLVFSLVSSATEGGSAFGMTPPDSKSLGAGGGTAEVETDAWY